MSATRTVQLTLGASRDNISAQLSLLFCYYTKRYGRMHFSCNGGRKSMDGLA
ncbi:hypothetical protein HMPREF9344_01811 [Cutibacterium acnes HL097PA1]|nr:hypothetical protein HMPREF9344_01811 [Cutibacterium acnes HL097PA1]